MSVEKIKVLSDSTTRPFRCILKGCYKKMGDLKVTLINRSLINNSRSEILLYILYAYVNTGYVFANTS